MKEIGGFIEFERFTGEMLYENGIKLNSAQNCLRFLIREKKIKTIWLPYYLCESVTDGCKKERTQIHYYHVNQQLQFDLPEQIPETDWLYIVNYFGQLSDEYITALYEKHNNIILDNVQAYFHVPTNKILTIYSCRKFFGVADGGILLNYESDAATHYEQDFSYNRMNFLLGRFEKGANEFYGEYVENNNTVGNSKIMRMSALTQNILHGINYKNVAERRNQNYQFLAKQLNQYNKLNVKDVYGPFMYPLLIENGTELRRKLIEQKIYIPKLWPLEYLENELRDEGEIANNMLPLPCDQRYELNAMEEIIDTIKKYM